MQSLKEKIKRIVAPSCKLIDFLFDRLSDNNYRGVHISQHNRYDLDVVINILSEINKYDKLEILIGDDNGGPYPVSLDNYRNFIHKIRQINGKGTLNSIKKNLFPDFDRMGLLERYNQKDKLICLGKKDTVKYVKLTQKGLSLINSKSLKEKYFHYLTAIEKLSDGFIDVVKNLLVDLYDTNTNQKTQTKYITLEEFTLFATGINRKFSNVFYSYDNILNFIKEFRNHSKFAREALISAVREWCDNIHKNCIGKNNDRDWHNWINESQQIIHIFSQTSFFEKEENNYILKMRFSNDSLFSDITEAKRSLIQKHLYFSKHNINKDSKYELHHIVSLYEADTIDIWKILDVWENMIYICGSKHNELHGKNYYKCYKLQFHNDNLQLKSIFNNQKFVNCSLEAKDILYNPMNKQKMQNKNIELLKSLN